jgi:DNA-binding MarR family transcriptional regulator
MTVKDEHVIVYDLFDRMAHIIQDLNKISGYVEGGWRLANSLQSMLGKVYRYEGHTVSELSKIYDIDLKNTTRYVNDLEKRGLLYKEKAGRQKILKLTEEGHALHKLLSDDKAVLLDKIIDEVGTAGLETAAKTLDTIAKQTHAFYEDIKV